MKNNKLIKIRILPIDDQPMIIRPLTLGLIILYVCILYVRIFQNSLTNWDDELYIFYNPYLRKFSIENFAQIFRVYFAGNYHPLTLLSLAANYQMGGVDPWPYQLTNLILHLCNTILVYVFIKNLLDLKSEKTNQYNIIPFITAILFGIHTLQVESVAWISERKNVLYAFFFLLSMISYIKYIKNQTLPGLLNPVRIYLFSILFFILSLLSKGMAVTLSLCIITIDFYAGRNLLSIKVIFEKIPFLLLSVIFGYVAILAQHSGEAIHELNEFSVFGRFSVAGYGFISYLLKLIYPCCLATYYPYPVKAGDPLPFGYYGCLILSVILLFLLWKYFRKNKTVIFGSLFFLANISMVIQLLPVGDAVMADRYVYIASIGFFFILGHLAHWLWNRYNSYRGLIFILITLYCIVLGVNTFIRVGVWENSLTLWNDALEKYPVNNDRGYLNRGSFYFDEGKYDLAFRDFEKLLQIDSQNSGGYIGMGRVKQAMNDSLDALEDFTRSIQLKPSYEAYIDRAVLRSEMNDTDGALSDLDSAFIINPIRTETYINKGVIYYASGKYSDALENYHKILELDPENPMVYMGMGLSKQAMKDFNGALEDFNKMINFGPSYDGYYNRALLKKEMNDLEGALADLDKAIQLDSLKTDAFYNKGNILMQSGEYEKALQNYNKALQINPGNTRATIGIALVKQALKQYDEAMQIFDSLLIIEPIYDGYINRAVLKKERQDFKGALSDLEKALQLDSLRTGAFINKARIYYETGNFPAAKNNYNRVLQIDSLNSNAYIGIGLILEVENNYSAAMDYFNKAISLNQSYEGYLNRAVSKIKQENIQGAWDDLGKALQIDPTRPETYINRGVIELNSGNIQNAVIEFNKAIERNENNYLVYLYRAIAKINLEDFMGSIADLDKSIKIKPDAGAYYYRGLAKLQLGRANEGCKDLNRSWSMGFKDAKDLINKNCR